MADQSLPYRLEAKAPNLLLRVIYFVLIGWWVSGVWMALAYALLLTIVLLPVSFWTYGRVGVVKKPYPS